MPRQPAAIAFAVSLGLHGVAGMWVKVRSTGAERPEAARPDVWAGRGIEIDRTELEEPPMTRSESEAATADERSAAQAEKSIGIDPVCVTNCVTPDATPPAPTSKRVPAPSAAASVASTSTAPGASTSAPVASTSAAASSSGTNASEAAFGALGLPAGVRHLPNAYTRALNQGSWGVAGFRTVPAGKLCEAHVSIAVGEDRKLGPLEYRDERERDALPALCRTMLENGYRLVSTGEFSLDPKRLEGGVMRLRIEVEVTDGPPDTERDPKEVAVLSNEYPTPTTRGRSTFLLISGRRVDAFIDIE